MNKLKKVSKYRIFLRIELITLLLLVLIGLIMHYVNGLNSILLNLFSAIFIVFITINCMNLKKIDRTEKEVIKEEKIDDSIIKSFSKFYELILLVDLEAKDFKQYGENEALNKTLGKKGNYEDFINFIHSIIIDKKEADTIQEQLQIENLKKKLEIDPLYIYYEFDSNFESINSLKLQVLSLENNKNKILFLLTDTTTERIEKQQYHDFLKETVTSAEKASRAKTIFLANISHDLRTPMNAILGMSKLAQNNISNPNNLKENLDNLDKSANQLLEQINYILELSNLESGSVILNEETTHISDLMEILIDKNIDLIKKKKIKLLCNINNINNIDNINNDEIIIDSKKLLTALTNVFENSIKYTQNNGSIILQLKQKLTEIESKKELEIIIEDTGIGMEQEVLSHIFDPFYRKDSTRSGKIAGTGIGLTIAMNLIHLMDGSIIVESELGKGTKTTIRVPVKCNDNNSRSFQEIDMDQLIIFSKDTLSSENLKNILEEKNVKVLIESDANNADKHLYEINNSNKNYILIDSDFFNENIDEFIKASQNIPVKSTILLADYEEIPDEILNKFCAKAYLKKPYFINKIIKTIKSINNTIENKKIEKTNNESNQDYDFSGKRILVVEDNSLNAEIASSLLEMIGFDVDIASDGQIAIDTLLSKPSNYYNIILMDIKMPNIDGYTATKIIRANERKDLQTIPIIAVTANTFQNDKQQSLSVGMNNHLEKPLNLNSLIPVLKTYCL